MRVILSVLLISALAVLLLQLQETVQGYSTYFNIVNECGASRDYVTLVDRTARESFMLFREIFGEYPRFTGTIVLTNNMPAGAAGLAYISYSPSVGFFVYKIALRCDLRDVRLTIYHEMAHAMQTNYMRSNEYGWWIESGAEALAVYASGIRSWLYDRYYAMEYWRKSPPMSAEILSLDLYSYTAPIVWLMRKFDPKEVFRKYSEPDMLYIERSYLVFLLSPWSWDREPPYDYACSRVDMPRLTGYYCRTSPREGLVVVSNVYVNATTDGRIAFASPMDAVLDYIATVRPPATHTVTQTTTVERVVERTVTMTQTLTRTETVTQTETKTIEKTVTKTETVEKTVPVTVTKTETATVIQTETHVYDYVGVLILLAVSIALIVAAVKLCSKKSL